MDARIAPQRLAKSEHRWDLYHGVRTVALIVAFALLVISVGLRQGEALGNNRTMQAVAAPPTLKIFPFQNLVL
jgi:hypothetical protein